MSDKPQFSIKAILGVIFAISVPLAMIAAGDRIGLTIGVLLLIPVVCCSVGYAIADERGFHIGMLVAITLGICWIVLAGAM